MASSTSTPDRSGTVSPLVASSWTASSVSSTVDGGGDGDGARSSGFILIPVLWVVFLLALAAASFSLIIRSDVQQASAVAARAEAAALADAGVNVALHDLVNARLNRSWQRRFSSDGEVHGCTIGESQLLISVTDEAGKVDLNAASEPLIRRLLIGVGIDGDAATRLSAAVLDYRDADDVRTPGGAEASDYREAGRHSGPKNAPFDSSLELAQVLGFDSTILGSIMPHVTVHSGLSGVAHDKASRILLEILAGGSSGLTMSQSSLAPQLPADYAIVSPERVLSITAQANGQRGGSFAREAIVRLTQPRGSVYSIASWRQVGVKEGLSPSSNRGAC